MKTLNKSLAISVLAAAGVHSAVAAERLYVYPALSQSEEQQSEDRYQCHLWARDATGFDPVATTGIGQPSWVRVPVPENPNAGATGKGLLGGAIAGAAIGAVDNDNAGRGAAIGAIIGTILGSIVEHEGERQSLEQAEATADDIYADRRELAIGKANYRRALSACLEGRGYRVN